MDRLDSMTLTHCSLADEHIEQLVPLRQLTYLCLNLNQLTDSSIALFKRFKRVTVLHLAHNAFSSPGSLALKSSLSDCHVQFE